jgi:phosphatidylserine/phosphatidylglycerophosphate/cardiolipin synthase-like enzyme
MLHARARQLRRADRRQDPGRTVQGARASLVADLAHYPARHRGSEAAGLERGRHPRDPGSSLERAKPLHGRHLPRQCRRASLDRRIDDAPAITHNKVIILDDATVITGSFDFTKSADTRNAENVVTIESRALAG